MNRGGGRQQFQERHAENWASHKPYNDHHHQQQQTGPINHQDSPSTSHQNPQSSIPISRIITDAKTRMKTPQNTRNGRNSRCGSRNKGVYVAKPQFVKNSEVGSSSSCQEGCEKEECGSSGGGYMSNSGNNNVGDEKERIEGCDPNAEVDEVGRRLRELLLLGKEEPELDDEVLRINDQLQEDELLAMESIYGENLLILEKQNGLRSFQYHVHVEVPRELTISTKLELSKDPENETEGSNDFSYSFKVQYLPPITLTCLLPKSYPSHLPPYFTIFIQWLEPSKVSELCSMLDSIWKELPGQEVIFQWTEWLRTSSLSHLGFDEEIILGPDGVLKTGDMRAVSGFISPDVDIPSLKSYNDMKQYEEFCRNTHECCICFSEYAGTDFIKLPCQHYFCRICMKTYSDMHIKERTVNQLLCPETKCGGMIPPSHLRRLLGEREFARWESLMLQKTLESMSDVINCPRCTTACIEDEDKHAQCSRCFFSFCTLCMNRRHVGAPCMTPKMSLQMLQERQKSTELTDEQRRREKLLIKELLIVEEILKDATQCPSCKTAISRTYGCNRMTCRNCSTYFCYRCGEKLDRGYSHFRGGGCELFFLEELIQDREIDEPEEVNYNEYWVDRLLPCPRCARLTYKEGNNNHILCGGCKNHYCYLCKKILKRGVPHFGPNGCKQHSYD